MPSYVRELRLEFAPSYGRFSWTRRLSPCQKFALAAIDGSADSSCPDQSSQDEPVKSDIDTMNLKDPVRKLRATICSLPPTVFAVTTLFYFIYKYFFFCIRVLSRGNGTAMLT